MSSSIPENIAVWRYNASKNPSRVRDMWDPFDSFFVQHGYTLWTACRLEHKEGAVFPPAHIAETPNTHVFETEFSKTFTKYEFFLKSPIHCPARKSSGEDVLIRMMSIHGNVKEEQHVQFQRQFFIELGETGSRNHVLPMLAELEHQGVTFAVFPLLHEIGARRSNDHLSDISDIVLQTLQGIAFCHENLVAHLDNSVSNILINHVYRPITSILGGAPPLRTLFPVRYYLIDFEYSTMFSPKSDPSTRLVGPGLPFQLELGGKYRRATPPEMQGETRYCPFRADIWQIGKMFLRHLEDPLDRVPEIHELLFEMCHEDPGKRPSAQIAYERMLAIHDRYVRIEDGTDVDRMPSHALATSQGGPNDR